MELALLRIKRSTDMSAVLFQSPLNSAIPYNVEKEYLKHSVSL